MKNCEHKRFQVEAKVTRLEDNNQPGKITGYTTDIKIWCVECGQPFEWIGVPGGYSPSQPMVSWDSTELRAPIRPSLDPIEKIEGKIYN